MAEGAQTGGMLEEKARDPKGVGKETPCVGESMASAQGRLPW